MEEGHLRRHSTDSEKRKGAETCVQSALAIQTYVKRYRDAFTLRRAPFLLSYAVYSAVSAILHQDQSVRGQHTDTITFFWTCLNELHRGSGFGLKKTLSILHDMIRELQLSVGEGLWEQMIEPSLDDSAFGGFDLDESPDHPFMPWQNNWGNSNVQPLYDFSPVGDLTFMNEQERGISSDTLYGLFAPPRNYA